MEISRKIRRNIRFWLLSAKYVLIRELSYPFNFVMGVVIDLLYQVAYILMFIFLFNNMQTVAGWSELEMMLLLSIQMVFSELFISLILVYNLRRLPGKIREGAVDFALLKPISSMMQLTIGEPYLPIILLVLIDLGFVIYSLMQLGGAVTLLGILSSLLIFFLGFVIVYSVCLIIVTLSFWFPDNDSLPSIAESFALYYAAYPRNIFKGIFRTIFYFVLPIVYVSSYPAEFLISGVSVKVIITAGVLAVVFFAAARLLWNKAIRNYSSASS